MTQCVPLTGEQHAFCIIWGFTAFIISAILKLTPAEFFEKMPIVVDENKAVDENDPIMSAYNKQAHAKVNVKKENNADEVNNVVDEEKL